VVPPAMMICHSSVNEEFSAFAGGRSVKARSQWMNQLPKFQFRQPFKRLKEVVSSPRKKKP